MIYIVRLDHHPSYWGSHKIHILGQVPSNFGQMDWLHVNSATDWLSNTPQKNVVHLSFSR